MNADFLAPWYRAVEYAAFGRALETARYAFLPHLAGADRVLVLGEGDGRALARMLTIAPEATFDIIEASPRMIELARRRIGGPSRVHFHCQNALASPLPSHRYDAVVTFFFLDCLTSPDLRTLLPRITARLNPGALWLMSDFSIPPKGWSKWHAKLWLLIMYRFFRLTTGLQTQTLPPIQPLLAGHHLFRTRLQSQRWGLLVAELYVYQPEPGTPPETSFLRKL